MDAQATRRGVPAAVFWGGLGVLAWATLTAFLGGGSAHADEQSDDPLDGLTSLVSNTVNAVTAPVAPVVTQVVAPVVTQVVAPVQQAVPAVVAAVTRPVTQAPIVAPVTAPVVHTVTETAAAVVEPVTNALSHAPVATLTDPILGAVGSIPVVGGLVSDLGVISAVGDVVGIVDDTTALLGQVTNETVPPVLEALDPTTSAPGAGPDIISSPPDLSSATATPEDSPVAPVSSVSRAVIASTSSNAPSVVNSADATGDDTTRAPAGPPRGSPPVPASSSAGSGGASGAAHARLNDLSSSPLRAGERTSGAPDDVLPSSPVADTDVSPD